MTRIAAKAGTAPLKHIAQIMVSNVDKKVVDGELPVRLCNYVDVYRHDAITDELPFMDATASMEQVARFTLRAGDVLITKDSETPEDIAVSAYVPQDLPGVVCGYHLAILRPRGSNVIGRYLHWAISSAGVSGQFHASALGITRFGLRQGAIGEIEIPVPPLAEQRAIADYLDRETARIDALIDWRSKTMDLLQSRVIARATQLTTGTNNGRTKPTGVRWMPNAAEGWPLPSLSQIFRIGSGTTPVSSDETLYDGGIPWLVTGDLTDGPVRFTSHTLSPAAIERYPSIRTYRAGSLVVAMYGATTGKLGLLEIDACVNQACCVLTSDRSGSNLERWAFYWMLGHRSGILSLTSGGGQPNISQEEIRSLRIPLPDDSIIDGVLAELDRELASTRRIAQVVEDQIALMRERRQAMITAAVTGQLDIREAA